MTCPHGLAAGTCEICRVLGTGPTATAVPVPSHPRRLPRPGTAGLGVAAAGVAVLISFVVLSQVLAAAWALFRLVQVVAVAAVSGWIGYRVGVASGRRGA